MKELVRCRFSTGVSPGPTPIGPAAPGNGCVGEVSAWSLHRPRWGARFAIRLMGNAHTPTVRQPLLVCWHWEQGHPILLRFSAGDAAREIGA
jgi:hypothetical protein